MLLYLVRHAHAVSKEPDDSRPLSPQGIECTRRLAAFFRQTGVFAPAQVWHSPLRRARETAQILLTELKLHGGLVESSDLLPEDYPELMVARLASMVATPSLALVGHEPHLSSLATLLVTGRTYPAVFIFEKGAVLALERTAESHQETGDPRWAVAWHLDPALLSVRPPGGRGNSGPWNPPTGLA